MFTLATGTRPNTLQDTLQNTQYFPHSQSMCQFHVPIHIIIILLKRFKGAVQNIRDISAPVVSHLPSSPTEWQGADGWVVELSKKFREILQEILKTLCEAVVV